MQMRKLSQLTDNMYNHPLTVSKSLLEIEVHVNAMYRAIKDVVISDTPESLEAALSIIEDQEQEIGGHFATLRKKFLGDPNQVEYAYSLLVESKSIREEVITLRRAGSIQAALEVSNGKGSSQFKAILEAIDPMVDFADNKALEFLKASQAQQRSALVGLIIAILLFSGSAYFVIRFTLRTFQSSEQKYSKLIHNMRDGVTIASKAGEFLYVNPSYANMMGYADPEELIGTQATDLYANPEEREAIFEKVMVDGYIENLELDLMKKDGSTIHVLVSTIANTDEEGRVIEIESIVSDITDRERSESILRQSEQKFRSVTESAADAMVSFSKSGFIISWNPAAEAMFQYSKMEILSESIRRILPEKIEITMEGKTREVKSGDLPTLLGHILELEGIRKDKSSIAIELTLSTWSMENEQYFTAVIRDISDRKLSETQLIRSEQLNKAITETAPDAIISIDHSGLVTTWNAGAAKMFGYNSVEMIGGNLDQIVPSDYVKGHTSGIGRLAAGGEEKLIGRQIEIEAVRKDGLRFPIELGLSAWQVGEEKNYTAIIRDITERKTSELKVVQALEDAKQANSLKDQFIANISHEIRTPLNSIIGFSDLFHQRYSELVKPRDQEIFGFITKSSNRLMHTVDSMLNISLLKSGNLTLQPTDIDLNMVVLKVASELRGIANEKGLELNINQSDKPALIYADEYCTYQSIFNLTDNAIKFTYEGNVHLEITQIGGKLVLLIRDTGIGISDEYQDELFTPYTQESEGFTKNYQGIGLGLALTKQYLDINGISLKVDSKVGEGTTFTLVFPSSQGAGL